MSTFPLGPTTLNYRNKQSERKSDLCDPGMLLGQGGRPVSPRTGTAMEGPSTNGEHTQQERQNPLRTKKAHLG